MCGSADVTNVNQYQTIPALKKALLYGARRSLADPDNYRGADRRRSHY